MVLVCLEQISYKFYLHFCVSVIHLRYFILMRWCITPNVFPKFCKKNQNVYVLFKVSQNANLISKLYFLTIIFFLAILVAMATVQNMIFLKRFMKKEEFSPYFTNYNIYDLHLRQTLWYTPRHHLCKIMCNCTTNNVSELLGFSGIFVGYIDI